MTHRHYYTDPYRTAFEASVVRVDSRDGRTLVKLDATAFYPTSGGQPFDTGTLLPSGGAQAALRVVDVFDEDDDIVHVVEGNAGVQAGDAVRGAIDWPRRFDHMQQHTGQHVLSAAFDHLHAARTVSFHLGAESCTIDLSREASRDEIAAAETEANRIVWEDRPVSIRFATAEEAAALPLRKEPARKGALRLIDVEGFDLSACGGTHVGRTGSIGMIAAVSWERFKGGQRVEFVCGGRALSRLRQLRDHMAASVRVLSVSPAELPSAVERLQAETKDLRRAVIGLQQDLAVYRAQELAAAAERVPAGHLVLRALDADAASLKALATAVIQQAGHVAVLTSAGRPALVVVASSAAACQANQLVGALTRRFGGRGGGKPDLAQAGGLEGSPQEVLDEARRLLLLA